MGNQQVVKNVNLEVIEKEMKVYQRKQTLMKRNNTPIILVGHPLFLIKSEHYTIGQRSHLGKNTIKTVFANKSGDNIQHLLIYPHR